MSRLIRIYTVFYSVVILTDTPIWNNGFDSIQKWKSAFHIIRGERVKQPFFRTQFIRSSLCLLSDFLHSYLSVNCLQTRYQSPYVP